MDDEVRALRRRLEQAPQDDAARAAFVKALQRAGGDRLLGDVYAAGARCAPGVIEELAASEEPMLVEGGPPIGRLATARALHDAGPRRAQPFIELRVRDAPETLLEPTLFGVLTGVMTGRHNDRPGYLELAAGGTLLLEGLEGVPAFVQRKLVRMLEERRFQQVQTGVWIPLAARLIVGTEAIAAGPLGDRLRARTLHLAG